MKNPLAPKLATSEKHNRTLNFRLANGETIEITIGYTGHSNVHSAVNLDGEVIPFILAACNKD